jgi:hypothetical protein
VTVTVNVPETAFVAIVLMTPAALIEYPAGRPVAVHEYGISPPVAASVVEYDKPTSPLGSDAVVMASGATGVMVNE